MFMLPQSGVSRPSMMASKVLACTAATDKFNWRPLHLSVWRQAELTRDNRMSSSHAA